MRSAIKFRFGAAAALVTAIAGCNSQTTVGPSAGHGSSAPPTSAPAATTTPPLVAASERPTGTPGPWMLFNGSLVAHEYFTRPFGLRNEGMTFTFTVPDGWMGFESVGVFPETGTEAPTGMGFGVGMIERLYSDPCKAKVNGVTTPGDVIVGPTVDDLADAFGEQTAYEATSPVDVKLAGWSGVKVDLQLPIKYDCELEAFRPWEGSIYTQGPGDRWHLWILDVDGARVVVVARDFAATSAADRAELQGIVDSLRITP